MSSRMSKVHQRVLQSKEERPPKEQVYTRVKIWDEVNGLKDIQMECFSRVTESLMLACDFIKDQEVLPLITNTQALREVVEALDAQYETYRDRLYALRDKHTDRKGAAVNADENMEAIALGQEYADLQMFYNSVMHPLTVDLTRQLLIVEKTVAATKRAKQQPTLLSQL